MKQLQRWKILLTALCVLAAGTAYRISREIEAPDTDTQTLFLTEEEAEEDGDSLDAADIDKNAEDAAEAEKAPSQETSEEGEARCYVHICGEVNRPGVYEMAEDSRVFQVVEEAGGFTGEAAEGYLNMAGPIADGMKIVVPAEADLEGMERYGTDADSLGAAQSGMGHTGSREGRKVNLNTADPEELMTLTGIGQARAEDIVRFRTDYGPFEKIEDVMKVSGIKDAAFEKIKDDITV